MIETRNQHKIVFLVDVNQNTVANSCEEKTVRQARTVILSVFRILTHFSAITKTRNTHKKKSKQPNLLWGFKYFNSRCYNIKLEKNILKEFKSRHFDEFENEVERRFDEDIQKLKSNEGSHGASKTYPCTFFGNALNELLYDFEWEAPDITSPVKRRHVKSNNKASGHLLGRKNHFVFLLRPCPKTPQQLRNFAGKRVLDADIFVDACMKPKLLENFRDNLKLQLFWIDTDFEVENIDIDSLFLVEKAIHSLQGSLIPANSLIQLGKSHLSNLSYSNFLTKRTENVSESGSDEPQGNQRGAQNQLFKILPHTSIIEFYLKTNKTFQQLESFKCKLVFPDGKFLCNIELVQVDPSRCNERPRQSTSTIPLSLLTSDLTSTGERHTEGTTEPKALITRGSHLFSLQNASGDINLRLYGLLSSAYLEILGMKTDVDYICTGVTQEDSPVSVTFDKVLFYLHSNNSALILKAECLPSLLVLKPLTSTSATLMTLCLGKTLVLERHLHKVDSTDPDSKKTTDTQGQEHSTGKWSELINRLTKSKCSVSPAMSQSKDESIRGGCFDPSSTDKTHLPGCKPTLVSLIDKLNERVSQLDFLSGQEVTFLKKLQKAYRQENLPIRPRGSTPVGAPSETSTGLNENEKTKFSQVKQESRKGRGSIQSRGEILVARSRQTSHTKEEEEKTKKLVDDQNSCSQHQKPSVDINKDFSSEEELENFLKDLYDKIYLEDKNLFVSAQTIVTVTLHYMKERGTENAEDLCEKLLQKEIIVNPAKLREKYLNNATEEDTGRKIKEFQVQIILRFECLSMFQTNDQSVSEEDQRVEDIVTLLRTLSFSTEPKTLSDFMRIVLVDNYIHTLPQILTRMYDELMQPIPEALESLLSPDKSADQSVFSHSVLSCNLDKTEDLSADLLPATQPASNKADDPLTRSQRNSRGRKLVHHPSLIDIGSKRQIVVQTKLSDTQEKSRKSSRNRSRKDLEKVFAHEKKKLERRKSVAVMESSKYSPGRRKRSFSMLKSPKSLMSPPSKASKRRKVVAETPSHKQRSQSIWKRLEKERRRTHSVTSVKIVQESPMKKDEAKKDSPSQNKRALNLVRRSFYSAGPVSRTRSLTQSMELADRIAGRQRRHSGRLSSVLKQKPNSSSADFKSPDKNSSFLLSQLMGSPTPKKVAITPSKMSVTPIKVIPDSPSMNTRSKSPGTLLSLPKLLFEDSPKKPRGSSVKRFSPHQRSSGLRTKSFAFSETKTPTKSHDVLPDSYLSPSQNTRSKVNLTPTRHSVRAVLFGKSPESKSSRSKGHGQSANIKTSSPHRNLNKNSTPQKEDINIETPKKRSAVVTINASESAKKKFRFRSPDLASNSQTSSANTSMCTTTLSWLGEGGDTSGLSFFDKSVPSGTLNKTPSPTKKISAVNNLQGDIPSTPSPSKQSVIKTPKSLDKWPRKKRGRCEPNSSPKFVSIVCSSKTAVTTAENEKKSDLSSSGHSEVSMEASQDSLELHNSYQSSDNPRKRSLNLSPENMLTNFSPSKRRRVLQGVHGSEKIRVSYCLHSRLLTKRMSSAASGKSGMSEGFPTDFISSQGSLGAVSEQDGHSLSQASVNSIDYFSSTSDEVFLTANVSDMTQRNSESVTDGRENTNYTNYGSNSPIFGSGKKRKYQSRGAEPSGHSETNSLTNTACNSGGSSSKVSPAQKYSPNVTVKSLIHLINSPLLNSPGKGGEKRTDYNSPKIDQDSLNIRRQRMSGRSRRSLNLQK